ncbi:KTSC domain-containing protein [Rhizobiaceae bacterium BDR2-2]|uniref:KTSC domain-containing protein n=1 Tax=Ectorhizobium quercum TaxID=2965071 RepID=A0AAE3MZV7_9HYPH|nr:hypothetical protein [Ectorhizobium quercum]MCX8997521.1 KTSC domain-containing protein [Ectorhizobium quercum]
MLMLPVHSKRIAALHFDPDTERLWIAFRDGCIHSVERIDTGKVMHLLSKIPLEKSTYFQTHP